MSKILVTGASGQLGRRTLNHLRLRRPADALAGLARNPDRASDLAAAGIEIRTGDYSDYGSLLQAFAGVDKLLLVPTHAFTDREAQHRNVIIAARDAGVRHVIYTPIIRRTGSELHLAEITDPDRFTEQVLEGSGLSYTIAAHPPFMESFQAYIGDQAYINGVRVPAGDGRVAATTREDLAEAQAVLLSEPGHENKTYNLDGDPAVSFADVADILSELHDRTVPYLPVSDAAYVEGLQAAGMPPATANFLMGWMDGINRGEWGETSGDLHWLLGRKPTTAAEYFRDHYIRLGLLP